MYILEFKEFYIIKEPLTKNCTHQTYRWKQAAICEAWDPLQDFIKKQRRPDEWRIVTTPAKLKGDN